MRKTRNYLFRPRLVSFHNLYCHKLKAVHKMSTSKESVTAKVHFVLYMYILYKIFSNLSLTFLYHTYILTNIHTYTEALETCGTKVITT